MPFMIWKPEYSVGVSQIDDQHKKLVEMLSRLHQAMEQGQGKAVLGGILGELVAYCGSHFATEERLMSQYGYPDLERHRDIHRKMSIKAAALERDFSHSSVPSTVQVAQFLKDWLNKHILETDMRYSAFFKQKGLS